jgi:hypothetical protein
MSWWVCAKPLERLVKVDVWMASTSYTGVDVSCSSTAITWRQSSRSPEHATWSPPRPRSARRSGEPYFTHATTRVQPRSFRRSRRPRRQMTMRSSAWGARCSCSDVIARPVIHSPWPARCAQLGPTTVSIATEPAEMPQPRERAGAKPSRQTHPPSHAEPRCYSRRTTFESPQELRLAAPKVGARPLFFTPRSWEESRSRCQHCSLR